MSEATAHHEGECWVFPTVTGPAQPVAARVSEWLFSLFLPKKTLGLSGVFRIEENSLDCVPYKELFLQEASELTVASPGLRTKPQLFVEMNTCARA